MTAAAPAPDQGAAEQSAPIGALSQLIQEALDTGDSYQRIADRANKANTGESVSKAYLQRIVKNPPANPPSAKQLAAIANALGKPVNRVREAAAEQWLQYEATELAGYDAEVRIIVGHLAGKSPEDLRRWRYMIEAEERAKRDTGQG
jgi:transcriptional regulator with XRE-family HTH domain